MVARRNDPLNSISGSTRVTARRTAAAVTADTAAVLSATTTTSKASVEDHRSSGGHSSEQQKKGGQNNTNGQTTLDDEGGPVSQTLSRGQRKRLARRDQFLRKEKLILSSLMLQRQEEQKRRIDGLDAIKQALLDTTTISADTTKGKNGGTRRMLVSTNKAKQKLMVGEMEHMNLILQHPAYKADPFETMQQHLRNTFAEDRKQQELQAKQRTTDEKLKAVEKAKLKKEQLEGVKKRKNRKVYKPRRSI